MPRNLATVGAVGAVVIGVGTALIVTQRSVDRCINTLRGKIEVDPERPVFVRTIRDVGYRFETG